VFRAWGTFNCNEEKISEAEQFASLDAYAQVSFLVREKKGKERKTNG